MTLLVREQVAQWPQEPGGNELLSMLRLVSRWRSQMLANTYVAHEGARVRSGPFAGMDYVTGATEGALVPRLLGVYEAELHPHFEAMKSRGIECVVDVGCAEGYYAIGLARMMPDATIYAYDTDPNARNACAKMAAANGVTDRVIIGGMFEPDGFQMFAGQRTLVMVDTEGAEIDILQPALSPALAHMHIIVETHDGIRAGALEAMMDRFSPTHDILKLDLKVKAYDMPQWLVDLSHLDQLLASWEWRSTPTPWLVMTPKGA